MELVGPLTRELKAKLEKLYATHKRIDLAIGSILEGQQGGSISVWVDDLVYPQASAIKHGSFTRFAGDPEAGGAVPAFISSLETPFFVQPSPVKWIRLLQEAYGERLKQTKRYVFSSNPLSKSHLAGIIQASPWRDSVRRLEKQQVNVLWEDDWGKYHFMNYAKPEELVEKGIGYYIEVDGEIASCCSSALNSSKGYEVNIITKPAYRRQGMAQAVAARFIVACLEKNLEPHWDGANAASKKLAMQLGYECVGDYDLYYAL